MIDVEAICGFMAGPLSNIYAPRMVSEARRGILPKRLAVGESTFILKVV
jgi:hypothetical protein